MSETASQKSGSFLVLSDNFRVPAAISSNSSMSLKSTQVPSPAKPLLPAWLLASSSESTTSSSRRICRICQMHEGDMVRPCDCAGTMGDVHEECLTKWVNMSNKKTCEICKSEYAKSGAQFKKFKEWSKPNFSMKILVHLVIIALLGGMIGYVADVMSEREFYKRVIEGDIVCRPDDTGRILLIVVLSVSIVNNVYTLSCDATHYLKAQRRIRFINKHS